MTTPQFPSIDALYDAYPAARHSPESDYGCWWKDDDGGNWRLTFIHHTGQFYAEFSGGTVSAQTVVAGQRVQYISAGGGRGPVLIVGIARPMMDDSMGAPDPCEKILEGWAEKCGEQGSLQWAIDRIQENQRLEGMTVNELMDELKLNILKDDQT